VAQGVGPEFKSQFHQKKNLGKPQWITTWKKIQLSFKLAEKSATDKQKRKQWDLGM
jgi:hypothetical protein